MSELCGIFYFDLRPISEADRCYVRRGLERFSGAARMHAGPGLLMGCSSSPDALDDTQWGSSPPHRNNICTFDGRLDNAKDLAGRDHRHGSPGPADYALAAYEARGPEGLGSLIGDWSLAIWDAAARAMLLASDYAGIRPLYYHRTASRLIWSSSLEHLAQWTGIEELDEEFVAAFLTRGSAGMRTPFRGIYPVPAGCSVRISSESQVTARHWHFPVGGKIRYRTDGEYEERMRDLFQEAVGVRLRTDRPVCAELSGGLDSSSVVCAANQLIRTGIASAPGLTSFTYQFPHSPDERFYRAVEAACGISTIHLDTDAFPPVTPSCAGFAEPLLWAPRLSEVARRMAAIGSGVLLTGQGGDLIMGNWLDDAEQAADLLSKGRWLEAVREAFTWSQALQIPVYSVLWRAVRPDSRGNPELTSAGSGPSFGNSLLPSFRRRVDLWGRGVAAPAWAREANPSLRKRLVGLSGLLEGRTLRCPDSLQAVSYSHPFAHRPLVEFMLGIPARQVCRPGEPRRLMRRALAGIVPDSVLRRRSKGNYEALFVQSLRPCAAGLLQNLDRMRLVEFGYVDRDSVRLRLERLMQGLECGASQLRSLILLECWLRLRDWRTGEDSFLVREESPKKATAEYPVSDCEGAAAPVASVNGLARAR